jgi:hypothetical protein
LHVLTTKRSNAQQTNLLDWVDAGPA